MPDRHAVTVPLLTIPKRMSVAALAGALLTGILLGGCTRSGEQPGQAKPAGTREFPIEGKVISVDQGKQRITLAHKDIPGFMTAMTMPFKVRDSWVFNVAQPGDELRATLVVPPASSGESYLEQVSINRGSGGGASSTSPVHVPAIGETPPEFSFVDQDGGRLSLRGLRGRPVLLTFIYTRCPLPDFCIRMSGNFAALLRELKEDQPALYRRLLLVSISIDPEYDTPAVLRRYGTSYAGAVDPGFAHWKFVRGTAAETRRAADFFGLSYAPDGGQIVHSLRTVLLAPDGSIAAQFAGNEWKPAEVEAELKKMGDRAGGGKTTARARSVE